MLSCRTFIPASSIHSLMRECACRIALDANGRVMASASSLHAASSSQRRIAISAGVIGISAQLGERDLLRALPEDDVAELLQVLHAIDDGCEVVARELAHPAGKQGRAVREQ